MVNENKREDKKRVNILHLLQVKTSKEHKEKYTRKEEK